MTSDRLSQVISGHLGSIILVSLESPLKTLEIVWKLWGEFIFCGDERPMEPGHLRSSQVILGQNCFNPGSIILVSQ